MARVKRAVHGRKHHRAILEPAKGYYGNKSRSYRAANEQVMHSLQYAYRDRRARKGDFRKLWIQRINAGCRAARHELQPVHHRPAPAGVEVDRKVLADLAVTDPAAFAALVKVAEAAAAEAGRRPRSRRHRGRGRGDQYRAMTGRPGHDGGPADRGGLGFKHQRVQRLRKLVLRRRPGTPSGPSWSRAPRSWPRPWTPGRPSSACTWPPRPLRRRRRRGDPKGGGRRCAGVRPWPGRDRAGFGHRHAPAVAGRRRLPGRRTREPPATAPVPTAGRGPIVVCVDVRDPGNLGTVLRSAEAAGAAGVICCAGTVDVYNPKCVRASAGSLFHVQVVSGGDPVEVLSALGDWGVHRMATRPSGGTPYFRADLTRPTAIVLGNEAPACRRRSRSWSTRW